jgi:hypothetical protein
MVQNDGGEVGKLLGRAALAGVDGDEQLLLRGGTATPASDWRRSWTRDRGKKGSGECGVQGEEKGGREKGRGGQHGQAVVVAYLGHGELEEGDGDPGLRGLGPGLLAVHKGEGSGVRGERQRRCGELQGTGGVL